MHRLIRTPLAVCLLAVCLLALTVLTGCHPVAERWEKWRGRPKAPFQRVSAAVAYEIARDSPGVLILDLRKPDEYQGENGHLPRAWNVPLARLTRQLPLLHAYREDTFLVYCRNGDTCGEEGMKILVDAGFEDAILLEGGIDAWVRQGFKTVLRLSPSP